jgi:hypothetical protein
METHNSFGLETIPASTPVSAESTGIASILLPDATATLLYLYLKSIGVSCS